MAMITLPERPPETPVLLDARHLTVWQAVCMRHGCHERRKGAISVEHPPVVRWAAAHAADGRHTVAIWCAVAGQRKWRPVMLRYSDPGVGWPWWEWVCMARHPDRQRPTWQPGRATAVDALRRWWDHDCVSVEES
jgi:hypothetical protein